MYSITVAVICGVLSFGDASPHPAEVAAAPGSCQAEMSAFPLNPGSKCCTSVGGPSTDILHQHPWAALVNYKLKNGDIKRFCAGTLISDRYLLTAAHCLTGLVLKTATPTSVTLGEYDLRHKGKDCVPIDGAGEKCNDGPTNIEIEATIPHPKYNGSASKQNDIALIRLKKAAPYTDFIRPICLPTKNLENSRFHYPIPLVAVTWFKNLDDKDFKMLVSVPYVDQLQCQAIYRSKDPKMTFGPGEICAGGLEDQDTCNGDGGGPLVHQDQERSELIGTVSFGVTPCGQRGAPSVYTNVYEYIDWIKSNIVA